MPWWFWRAWQGRGAIDRRAASRARRTAGGRGSCRLPERRVWEVKTGALGGSRTETQTNSLGRLKLRGKRVKKARVLGCLVSPVSEVEEDAAEAARERIVLLHHGAVMRLFDLLADRLREYIAPSKDGRAEARGNARTAVEPLLPGEGWLSSSLRPSEGRVVTADDVGGVFPMC